MSQIVVKLLDRVGQRDVERIMRDVVRISGVHSARKVDHVSPRLVDTERCDFTPSLFGDADTLQPAERLGGT